MNLKNKESLKTCFMASQEVVCFEAAFERGSRGYMSEKLVDSAQLLH